MNTRKYHDHALLHSERHSNYFPRMPIANNLKSVHLLTRYTSRTMTPSAAGESAFDVPDFHAFPQPRMRDIIGNDGALIVVL